jgi:predicted Ser/Thr protein kinase
LGELEVGSLFDRYRVERELGRGGFGVVYLATDTNPHLTRKVALKVLDDALGAQTSFRERFFRESRLASALDHPNIVAIHDAGEHEGALYIAMRYVEGTDLRAAIAARSTMDPRQAVAIITQVAAGLDAAHAAGVVHRDVKPANVLLTTDLSRAYLADFGLTKQLASETSALSSVGQFLGTFAYAAPEQLEGREVDGRTDQYALGCTLFECLTGRIPFDGSPQVVLTAHLTRPPPAVTELCPWLPPAIDAVIARAMAKSPDGRYYNCGEFAAAAANALTVTPRTAERVVVSRPGCPDCGAEASTGALFCLACGRDLRVGETHDTVAPPAGWAPPAPEPRAAPPTPSAVTRARWPLFAGVGGAIALVVVLVAVLAGGGGGSSKDKRSSATTVAAPTTVAGFPDGREKTLLSHVPLDTRETCVRGTSPVNRALAVVDCVSAGAQRVSFNRMATTGEMGATYGEEREARGIDVNTGQAGACPYEYGYRSKDGATGRELCAIDTGGRVSVIWTNDGLSILTVAARTDGNVAELLSWTNAFLFVS